MSYVLDFFHVVLLFLSHNLCLPFTFFYSHQLKFQVSAEASVNGVIGSFSASASYKKAVKEVTKGETTTLQIVGRANVYKARLSSLGTISKVNSYQGTMLII